MDRVWHGVDATIRGRSPDHVRRSGPTSVGRALPTQLAPFSPGPYTLGRFLKSTLNPDDPTPDPG
jgi:hypothetical protein